MTRDALIVLVAIAVTVMWGLATLASIVTHDVAVLSITTPVMVIIAGGLMAARRGNGKNGAA